MLKHSSRRCDSGSTLSPNNIKNLPFTGQREHAHELCDNPGAAMCRSGLFDK